MASTAAPGSPGVYWQGADGNYYIKGVATNGVQNIGSKLPGATASTFTKIADPNPPKSSGAPANPNGSGSGGSAAANKANDIALQLAGLGAVDQQTSSGIGAVDSALNGLLGQYDTENQSNQTNYKTQSDTNETNLQKNKQTALVNAAQGRQGLFGTLSSLGALNGSGVTLANQAVQRGANEDLSGASNNFATNQSGLDTAINAFDQADAKRRQDAQTAASNARTSVQNQGAQSKQTFYTNLANDYSAEGDAGDASKYTSLAASLYPQIAQTSIPNTNIAYTGAAYTPAALSSYLAGAGSTQVTTTPNSGVPGSSQNVPGLVATDDSKKKAVPLVPVPA